jgi:hypothetical protein
MPEKSALVAVPRTIIGQCADSQEARSFSPYVYAHLHLESDSYQLLLPSFLGGFRQQCAPPQRPFFHQHEENRHQNQHVNR